MSRASATKAVDLGSIPGRVKLKYIKIGIHSYPCLTFSNKRDNVKPPMYVVDRWQLDSKTERLFRRLLAKAIW